MSPLEAEHGQDYIQIGIGKASPSDEDIGVIAVSDYSTVLLTSELILVFFIAPSIMLFLFVIVMC